MSHAEAMQERVWRFKAWVLQTLDPAEMVRLLESRTPPTIGHLIWLARQRAAEHAGKCQHCGEPLPIDPLPATAGKAESGENTANAEAAPQTLYVTRARARVRAKEAPRRKGSRTKWNVAPLVWTPGESDYPDKPEENL